MAELLDFLQLDKEDPREILKLKAKEVSVVDRPAILREFLVVKRQEDTMGAFESDPQNKGETDEVIEKMSWLKYADVEKALPPDLTAAIKAVMPFLKKQAGEEGAPKDEIGRIVAFLGKVAGGQYPEPTTKAKKKDDEEDEEKNKQACPKCGGEVKDGVCTKCGEKVKAVDEDEEKRQRKGKTDDPREDGVKKSEPLVQIMPDGSIQLSSDVTKGKNQFTSERTTKLKDSVNQLLTMLAQVDQDAAKGIIDELTKSVLPANVKWVSGTTATPASVKKSIEEAVTSALKPVLEQNTELQKRLDSIENTRPAPKSSDGDGDKELVKKSDNPWKGLPLS